MSENQKIIDNYSVFTNLLTDNLIKDYLIILSYTDFVTAVKDKAEIKFENCYFEISFLETGEEIFNLNCNLIFHNCGFGKRFEISKLKLNNSIMFNRCDFDILIISNITAFKQDNRILIELRLCHTNHLLLLSVDTVEVKINCHCENKTIPRDYINSPLTICNLKYETTEYENHTFDKNEIYNINQSESISFTRCNFLENLKIRDFYNKKLKAINFNSCKFNKILSLTNEIFDIISITDSIFNDKLLIIESSIKILELINCSFENTVKIVDLTGEIKDANFERSTIKGMFFFNGFKDDSLININNSSSVSFNHIFLESAGYLIIRKIQNGNFIFDYANILGQLVMQELDIDSLQMHNASIIGSLIMQDIKLKELDLKNTSLIGKLVFNPSDTLNIFDSNVIQNRETAYLLKQGKQEEGDSISASHFKRKELQLYLKDCTSNFNPNKVKECIVLFFNKISNDFGQSWVRGIIFTMSFAYMFYLLINFYGLEKPIFRFAWSLEGFGTAWKEYLKILNVLNFNDKLDNFKFTALGETLFFVSKIFVSYGIYQTVSAFRKFGK